jgi:hypothetical protein
MGLEKQAMIYHSSFFSTNITTNSTDKENQVNYRMCKSQGAYCVNGFFGPVFASMKLSNNSYI